MRRRCCIFLLIAFSARLASQDIHFSQYDENPLLLNPSLAGAVYPLRASVAYRNQWRSVTRPYNTMGVSVDSRLGGKKTRKAGKFGQSAAKFPPLATGMAVYRDNSGDGSYSSTTIDLAISCKVSTGESSFLSAGLQGNFSQKQFGHNALLFPNQYNGSGYDASLQHNESFVAQRVSYGDLASGLVWCYGQDDKTFLTNRAFKFIVGAAAYHIPERSRTFISNRQTNHSRRYVFHSQARIALPDIKLALAPSVMVQIQSAHTEYVGGLMVHYMMGGSTRYTGNIKRSSLGIGAYYRNGDAVIVSALLELNESYAIGFSYDLNVSPLKTVSQMKGAMEINLRFSPARNYLFAR